MGKPAKTRFRKRPIAETLEKRFLLSVDIPGLDAADNSLLTTHDVTDGDLQLVRSALSAANDANLLRADRNTYETVEPADNKFESVDLTVVDSSVSRQLIVIDESVDDYKQFVKDIESHSEPDVQFEFVYINNSSDGIEQITQSLDGAQLYDAIHIISHGNDASISLGNTELTNQSITRYQQQLSSWSESLARGADILIYGCDLAGSDDGQSLVDAIATLSGRDVAASVDETGHASLDANWELEYRSGDIEAEVPFSLVLQDGWEFELAAPSDILTTDTASGGLNINGDGGNDTYLLADDGGALLGGQTALTFEVQFSTDQPGTDTPLVSYTDSSGNSEFEIQISSAGSMAIDINGVSTTSSVTGYAGLQDGEQHTLTFTWNSTGGAYEVYVDGLITESGSGLAAGHTLSAGGALLFGQAQNSTEGGFSTSEVFSGELYSARLFSDVRIAAEIANSYRSDLAFNEPDMLAQWNFDKLSSDGIITESVSGNNLSVRHTSEAGFDASTPQLMLAIDENALNATFVGQVTGIDADREAQISSLLAADSDLVYSAETGKFYRHWAGSGDFDTANSTANTQLLNGVGGELATVYSANEQTEVYEAYQNSGSNGIAWLGASDATVEGEWRWQSGGTDGDLFWQGDENGYAVSGASTFFANRSPNDGATGSSQDYLAIQPTNNWNDYSLVSTTNAMLQWDADAVLDASHALTYSIESETVAGAFAIDSDTGALSVADASLLDYESNATHTLTIRTNDGSATYEENISISLRDVDEPDSAPSDLSSGIELNTDGGNNAYLQASDGGAILGGASEFTVEIAFATESTELLVLTSYAGSAQNDLNLELRSDGTIKAILEGGEVIGSSGFDYNLLRDGSIHNIALSWDNTNGSWAIHVDGFVTDSGSGLRTGNTLNGSAGAGVLVFGQEQDTVGGGFNSSQIFSGTLYDIRIWDEARSTAEIALNYQHKFDSGSLPSGLIANWQMKAFNSSDEIIDIVGANNLAISRAEGTGFLYSTPLGDLHIAGNSPGGTSAGFVVPSDPEVNNDIVRDGLFNESADPGSLQNYAVGSTFGDWTVSQDSVNLLGTTSYEESPAGGLSVDLSGNTGDSGGISQSLDTEAGKQYQIVFALSGNWDGGSALKALRVSADGVSEDFQVTQPVYWTSSNMLFANHSISFTADSDTTELAFSSLVSSGFGPVIADIHVIEIPSAIATILNNDSTLSYDAATAKFYRVVSTVETWADAQAASMAAALNGVAGQLVTVDSAYENEKVRDAARAIGQDLWLGASDSSVEGNWRWQEGDSDSNTFWIGDNTGTAQAGQYVNWDATQPDDSGGAEDRLLLDATTGQWSDSGNASTNAYMIEWDAGDVLANSSFSITGQDGVLFTVDPHTGELKLADPTEPDGFSDHILWLDAGDSATLTINNGTVTAVSDKTTNDNNASAVNGPTLQSGALNGVDAFSFDGNNDRLNLSDSSTTNLSDYSEKALSVVFQTSEEIIDRQIIYEQGGSTDGLNMYISDGRIYAGVWSESNGFDGYWGAAEIAQNETYVASLTFSATTGRIAFVVNGELVDTGVMRSELSAHNDSSSVGNNSSIGKIAGDTKTHEGDVTVDGSFFKGLIGEIASHNTFLSNAESIDLHAQLMNKWVGTDISPNYETATTHNVAVQVIDATGNSFSKTVEIVVDSPFQLMQIVPDAQTLDEDGVLTFSSNNVPGNALTVSDSLGSTNAPMRVSLSVTDGVLTLSQTTGLSFVEGSDGSNSFVIDGTESAINLALESMSFTPDKDFNGNVSINMTSTLDANLDGLYTFVHGSAEDQSAGTAQNGVMLGQANTVVDPVRGQVLNLDGLDDSVEIAGSFGTPANVTLAAWVNGYNTDGVVVTLSDRITLEFDVTSPDAMGNPRGVSVSYNDGSTVQYTSSGQFLFGDGWHHVAATFDETSETMTLFIDGAVVAQDTFTKSIAAGSSGSSFIGQDVAGNGDFDGQIDDVRIYSRALSATEIENMANVQTGSTIGPDLTQTFNDTDGDTGEQLLHIHSQFAPISQAGSISSLQLAEDTDDSPINLDLLVLRPDGSGNVEVIHRVPLTDSDIIETDSGMRTLDIGVLDVQAGDVIGHWSAVRGGSIPFSLDSGGSTGWSTYGSDRLTVGSIVEESKNSTQARLYGLSVTFDALLSSRMDEIPISVTAINDAPVPAELSSTSAATYDTAVAVYDFENGTDSTAAGGPAISVSSPAILSVDDGYADGGVGLLFPSGDVNSTTNPVSISTIPGIAASNEFSFSAFVRFDAGAGDRAREHIFDFGESNSNNLVFGRSDISDDLFLKLQQSEGSGDIFISNALAGIEGEWHHYGVSIDSLGNAQVFIDGVFVQETQLSELPNYSEWETNYIGSSHSADDKQFQGAMDDIAIFDNALTAEQMLALSQKRYSAVEQQPLNLHGTGMSVSDVDDNGGSLIATLSVGEGSILVDVGNSGVASSSVISTDTARLTGTKTQINNLLEGSSTGTIVYNADSDAPSATTTLTLSVNDRGNTGSDPGLTGDRRSEQGSVSQTINITAVNDSPELLGQELITNGNFDNGIFNAWTTSEFVTYAAESLNFGSDNKPGPHTASQAITTVAGETYTLEFDYRDVSYTGNQQLQVTVDGVGNLLTTEQIISDSDGVSFVTYRYEFTADSTSSTITFTDTSDNDGSTSNTTNGNDGQLDNISIRKTASNTVYAEENIAVIIDTDITLFDAELSDMNDFGGSTLTLVRSGGANVEDVFSAAGNLVFNGTTLELSSTAIGTFNNADGTLTVLFEAGTSQAQVDEAIQSIAYANTSDIPPSDIQIDWSLNDGNTGSQGSGPSLSATKSTTVVITAINDAPVVTHVTSTSAAAYDFESGTGSTVVGGPAISVGSPAVLSASDGYGSDGTGLLFPVGNVDSETNPVSISTIPGVATSNEFSFGAFVRFDAGNGDRRWERIFDFGGGASNNNILLARYQDTNDLTLFVIGYDNIRIADALLGVEGAWHHYGVSIDASGNAQLFIDGALMDSTVLTGSIDFSTWDENYIGTSNWNSDKRFQGAMDNIAIFDRALTAEEMQALAQYPVDEQQPLDIHGTGLSVSDADDNGGSLTVILTVGEGRVLVDAGDSGTVIRSGNSTDTVRLSGTETQINNLLAGAGTGTIVYTADSDTPLSTTTLTLTVNDQGNTGSDPGLTGDDASEEGAVSQTITITSINDSPELLGPDLIVNGDFATGDLSDWTTIGMVENPGNSLNFGSDNSAGPHSASQSITTVAGATYTLEFSYRDLKNNSNQQLQVSVDGNGNLLTTEQIVTDIGDTDFVTYRYQFTADSTASTITFTDTSDAGDSMSNNTFNDDGRLDDVSVRQSGGELSNVVFTENGSSVILDSDIAVFDAELSDANNFEGATLTLERNGGASSDDVFSAAGNLAFNGSRLELSSTAIGTLVNTSGTLTLVFGADVVQAQVDEVFQSIAYSNTLDVPPASVQIDWSLSDGNAGSQGSGSALIAAASTNVAIIATNDAPSNVGSLPGDIMVTEDELSNVDLSSIDLSDADAGTNALTVTLNTSTGGELTAAAGSDISLGGTGAALTVTGTLADLNNYFNTASNIRYQHGTADLNGDNADTIQINVNDNGNTGSGGGSDVDLGTVAVDISAINDTPVNTVPGTQSVEEEATTAITGISIADIDSAGADITTRLQVSNGVLSVTLSAGATISGGAIGTGDMTISGSVSAINATLGTLAYTGNTDVEGTSADTLVITTDDGGNIGSGGTQTDSDIVQIDITAVNDAPVVTAPTSAYAVNEQTSLAIQGTGFSVSDVDADSGVLTATTCQSVRVSSVSLKVTPE